MSIAAQRLAERLERGLAALAGAVLALLLALVLAGAAARYGGAGSLAGVEELALFLHVALVFGALPLVATSALAMRLDVAASLAGPSLSRVLDVLCEGVVVHATLVLAVGASGVIGAIGGRSAMLGLPEAWRFWPVLAGAVLALALMALRGWGAGRPGSALAGAALGLLLFAVSTQAQLGPVAWPSLVAAAIAFAALLIGAPLPHALLSGVALAVPFGAGLPQAALVQSAVSGTGRFLLLAIPFFLLAGALMVAGGLAERLVGLAASLLGHRRGGMAQTVLGTNLLFSGLSGSSVADAAFGAKVLAPALVESGYRPPQAAAIVAATAILPNIVPPSIAFLILAVAADLSVGALFLGGLWAGLFLFAVLALALHVTAGAVPGRPRASAAERGAALVCALPALGLAAVIVAGLRLGLVTTTEAASLAALYALALALILRRRGGLCDIARAFAQSAREAAGVGLLIAAAAPFAFLLAVDGLPGEVGALFASIHEPLLVLLLANLVLLAAGCVLDIGAGILLLAPLLMPVAAAAGIDPILFGVIVVVNLMVGGLTPPVGILVFVAARLSGTSPAATFRAVLPLLAALVAAILALSILAALWA